MKKIIFISLAFFVFFSCKKNQLSESKAVVSDTLKWDSNFINVCWDDSVANIIQSKMTDPIRGKFYSTLVGEVENYLRSEFGNYTTIVLPPSPWPNCNNLGNNPRMVSIGHEDFPQILGRSFIGKESLKHYPSLQMEFTYFDLYNLITERQKNYFLQYFLHEFFHAVGAFHEHERKDRTSVCEDGGKNKTKTTAENFSGGNAAIVYIGQYDIDSISNYCHRELFIGFSPTDLFGISYLYGFSLSDQFKAKIKSIHPSNLLKTKYLELQYPLTPEQLINPQHADLILWIQMWLALESRGAFNKHNMIFDDETSTALKNYQIQNNLESDSAMLGLITKNTISQFIEIHNNIFYSLPPVLPDNSNNNLLVDVNPPQSTPPQTNPNNVNPPANTENSNNENNPFVTENNTNPSNPIVDNSITQPSQPSAPPSTNPFANAPNNDSTAPNNNSINPNNSAVPAEKGTSEIITQYFVNLKIL